MKLSELLAGLPPSSLAGVPSGGVDVEVSDITSDSRRVEPRSLFVAVPGLERDGHLFVPDALRRGAVAIVGQRPAAEVGTGAIPYVWVRDSREALAWLSAAWHGFPARQMRIIGVTGTDGKTTTVSLIAAVLQAAGKSVGWISTVDARIGSELVDTGFHTTTPDSPEVQRFLAQMVAAGTEVAVVEATSHGLAQHRVTGCEFDVAVVTNITREHLDYHHSFEEYRDAKALLFSGLETSYRKEEVPKWAIVNADDPSAEYLLARSPRNRLTYGLNQPGDITARAIRLPAEGISFEAVAPGACFEVTSSLKGRFNVYNILAAVAVGVSQGVSPRAIQEGIRSVKGILGRMERIDKGQDFDVIIDFAHTPNALDNALRTVRELTRGRVIVVFGCAGLRDHSKRRPMGQIAARLADCVVLTAEDPRTEDVNAIIAESAAGCEAEGKQEGQGYWRIPDRQEAIDRAVAMARAGDLVIITGKGHERSMCFGSTEFPWSDHDAARKALQARLGRSIPFSR
ncbi:MAG: UDP-N-acetylmuramoyl-L-alanyl-D-glutamate--L-lysine ligase [Chloroflexi bacterium ADurb.Bin180]|jgi:UDP-N-acetylmuramoyl-L-alanyl-D-glutamate--2,6-diaminopimelate ligase|nr:MAG: UDP-N-acetylmuramoyl-L-alanyl-D-glutamate--L-lysine ligase [Chloroflexi bacterium ADurb.Bin180]